MKKTLRNGKTLVWMLGAVALMGGFSAQAATVGDLLTFLPSGAQAAVGLPDIVGVEKAAEPLLALPFFGDVFSVAVMLGGDTISEGLANAGIDVNGPAAGFLQVGAANKLDGCGVLMVQDAAKVNETLTSLLGGSGAEITLPGDIKGRFVSEMGVGFFLQGDKIFVGSTEGLLQQLATRIADPAVVNYGKEGPKDEVVIFSRIDIIEQSGLITNIPALGMFQPILDTVKPFTDEVILAVGEAAGKAYIRLAAHDISNAPVAAPAPLGLHGFMDPEAPVVLNLRLTPELINALSMTLMKNESTRQVGGYIRIASGLLGDELAVSFAGMQSEEVPEAVIAAKVKNAEGIPNLLKMLAKIEAPSYKIGENDVYVYPNISEGTDLHIGMTGQAIVVAPGEDALKTAVGRLDGATGAAGVNAEVVAKGVYGFLMIDGAKAKNLPPNVVPANLNLADVKIALTMGVDGAWRELVLSTPAGFSGIADVVNQVM